jgi:hypothetical protein
MNTRKVIYRLHATRRMFERKITELEILDALENGKVIESYPTDQPYPSRLTLGICGGRPLHVVTAEAQDVQATIIITVYEPDLETWEPGHEVRRKS